MVTLQIYKLYNVLLADIIKKYSKDVVGFSVGNGGKDSPNAKLNVAVSGAIAQLVINPRHVGTRVMVTGSCVCVGVCSSVIFILLLCAMQHPKKGTNEFSSNSR